MLLYFHPYGMYTETIEILWNSHHGGTDQKSCSFWPAEVADLLTCSLTTLYVTYKEISKYRTNIIFLNQQLSNYPLLSKSCTTLTHFTPLDSFFTSWKHKKTFSDVFNGYRKRPVAWNGLIMEIVSYLHALI